MVTDYYYLPPVFPPVEVPAPGGGSTIANWPDGTPLQLVVDAAVDDSGGWPGIWGWIKDNVLSDNSPAPATLNINNVIYVALTATKRLQQVVASTQTVMWFYITNALQRVNDQINNVVTMFITQAVLDKQYIDLQDFLNHTDLQQQIDQLSFFTGLELQALRENIFDTVNGVENDLWWRYIAPLTENLGQLQTQLQAEEVNRGLGDLNLAYNVIPQAQTDVINFLGPGIAAGVAGATVANQTKQWVDNCGQPMCDTVGPNTDWGKLFQALKLAALLAAFMELAGANASDIESLIIDIGQRVAGVVNTFESLFLEGGDTLAETVLSI